MFYLALVLLTVMALLFVIWPFIIHTKTVSNDDREGENVEIYQKNIQQLTQQLHSKKINQAQFDSQKLELDRDLLNTVDVKRQHKFGVAPLWPISMMALLISVSGYGYYLFGASEKLDLKNGYDQSFESKEAMLAFLADYKVSVQDAPKDVSAWWFIARNYMTMGDYVEAESAYRRALLALQSFSEVNPEDSSDIMTKIAQASFYQTDTLTDDSYSFLEQAIKLDPSNTVALGLLGIGSFKNADNLSAVKYWRKAQQLSQSDADKKAIASGIENAITQYLTSGGSVENLEAIIGPQINVVVDIAPEVNSDAKVVFVVARPVGQKMPVAVRRIVVDSWPIEVRLSNDFAMAGQTLESFNELELVVRLSNSGSAMSQAGDWQAKPYAFEVINGRSDYSLLINEQLK
jgi:cytochrome c-type biogenesis protein CcmH